MTRSVRSARTAHEAVQPRPGSPQAPAGVASMVCVLGRGGRCPVSTVPWSDVTQSSVLFECSRCFVGVRPPGQSVLPTAEASNARGWMPCHQRLRFKVSLYLSLGLPCLSEPSPSSPCVGISIYMYKQQKEPTLLIVYLLLHPMHDGKEPRDVPIFISVQRPLLFLKPQTVLHC